MLWGLFSLLACWTYCAQGEVNKHYKIGGFHLNTVRAALASLMMIPVIPFMEWPDNPIYYLIIIIEGAISVVGMMVQYNLAAKHNGRISCLHQPICIFLTFVLWLMIDHSQIDFLVNNPLNSAAILVGFIIFIFSLQAVRKNDLGIQILLAVIPVAVLYAAMGVISKLALESGTTLFAISMNFVFLSNIAMFALSLPLLISLKMKTKQAYISKRIITGGAAVAFFHTISWVFICAAVVLTPNPAYPSFITGTAPIWFTLYYKMRGIKDDASPIAGLCMGLAALIVMFATSYS